MGKFIDLTGKRFNRLVAIKRVDNKGKKTQWLFQCDCGNQKVLDPCNVKNGTIKSCGCLLKESAAERNFKDLTGKKIGRWTVLEQVPNNNDFVMWKCQCECGEVRNIFSNSLLNGVSKSCGCYKADRAHELNFNDLTGKKFGMLKVIERVEDYVSPNGSKATRWLCDCECGNRATFIGGNLTSGTIKSCGCLKESNGEYYIRVFLESCNIDFIQQYKFSDCRNKLPLPFDFYLPQQNICIEYDGQQHFEVVDFFGGKNGFEYRKNNDRIKNNYCKSHNIKLLRIPYYFSIKEMQDRIINILNP